MKSLKFFFVTFGIFVFTIDAKSQNDSLIFKRGNVVVGEVKEMVKGVLAIETDYSDSDFKIEWDQVQEFYSDQLYTLSLTDRSLWTGAKLFSPKPGQIRIDAREGFRNVSFDEIVYIRQLDDTFISKLYANVDLGYSLTKANNLRQYTARASLGYKAYRWKLGGTYDQVESVQDNVEAVQRTEIGINGDYSLRNGIFFGAQLNLLSNTEQRLDLRTTGILGAGYYIFRKNTLYWNVFLGAAINNESFDNTGFVENEDPQFTPARESTEGVIGTELNLYDIGDLNLLTNVYWFPSLTEEGRNRVNLRFDLKYDLPFDFYVRTGITYNYDSQPANGASTTDYVWQSGFGWEL